MFLFKERMLNAVREKRKTRTWRPLKDGQIIRNGRVYTRNMRALHVPDGIEAVVPKRGHKMVGLLKVHKITPCTPRQITHDEALAEGFESVAEFHQYLREVVYKNAAFDLDTPGYATTFEYLGDKA